MRFKASIVFGAAIAIATLILLYQIVSLPPDNNSAVPHQLQGFDSLESRIKKLEQDIAINHNTINEIHGLMKKINGPNSAAAPGPDSAYLLPKLKPVAGTDSGATFTQEAAIQFNTSVAKLQEADCSFAQSPSSAVDILMEDVYKSLPFENPDGGAWKQGWDVTYDRSQWTPEKPLKVFVVPHSHCDPGWIKTFERYYSDQVSHILDNMARKLPEDSRRRFIWAEISFFSMWWERQTPTVQNTVRKLVAQGQLEIVTGGWVMPDEAVTHYWSIIDQLITGHEWLRTHLNVRPNNGWSIDPFGVSPTLAYILKRSGLENMLVQRTHYAIKKHFATNKNLEFRWRQSWDPESSTEILCHMMPFYSYDIPHTCGPDPKVCCQFDFKRLPGSRVTCPWRIPPQPITPHNVQSRAEMLLDQYRKKAQLYRTNVLLVVLGDDFRYDTSDEWDAQFTNYQRLFDHMNAHSDYNVQAQFGTLSEYFHALREESRSTQQQQQQGSAGEDEEALFPSFAGDFFSYADKDDNYWTGYFTSRPYYKARSRMLAAKIRAAEILFSMAVGSSDTVVVGSVAERLQAQLIEAHKALGLFQHHDGITGTSKDHVVLDYANILLNGIQTSEHVMQYVAHTLLSPDREAPAPDAVLLEVSEKHEGASAVSTPRVLTLEGRGRGGVVVFNPHPHTYRGLVTIRVNTHLLKVVTASNEPVLCQVDPVLDGLMAGEAFDVSFPVTLAPLSLTRFFLTRHEQVDRRFVKYSTVTVRNELPPSLPSAFSTASVSSLQLTMKCGTTRVSINEKGLMESITRDGHQQSLSIQFVRYNARSERETSGPYLFLPAGPAEELAISSPPTLLVQGPLRAVLTAKLPLLAHNLILENSPGLASDVLTVRNLVNIRSTKNYELAMRLVSDVDNGETFFTDLNGFQIVRRVRESKLTLQGNYYPIASQAFIQDSHKRLTILTGQPHGGSSLAPGQLEVMQDRRLMQDDFRGAEQGVTDNVITPNVFRILLERRDSVPGAAGAVSRNSFPSLLAERALQELLFPPVSLLNTAESSGLKQTWVGGVRDVACDVQLVSLHSIRGHVGGGAAAGAAAALTLRRAAFDCSFPPPRADCSTNGGKVQLSEVLGSSFSEEVRQSTLSHLYAGVNITKSFVLTLQPMELYTFLLASPPRTPALP
ncbi:alpha-mannosidase 2 isoform X2 [Hyalella azteca]|uniref:Alpha-mannosidase n=1 Tax=Hyalella azteca TaxID=294128 RepID=A0A8B7PBR0_HYAAZ|nr:alpha-mannosidase 2 isoform X2 [Hyalella azteca]